MLKQLDNILKKDAHIVCNEIDLTFFKNKNIIVTGGTGLIGLNLIYALNEYRKSLKKSENFKLISISKNKLKPEINFFYKFNNIDYLQLDLSNANETNKLPECDVIIHAAGYGQPKKFLDDKISTLALNSSFLLNLIKKLRNDGTVLYLSSSEVYSGNDKIGHSEQDIGTTDPYHPRSSYIESKRFGETIIKALNDNGYRAYSARISLAYGPGVFMNDERAINQFIIKSLKNKLNLLDTGKALRTYCYITDISKILLSIVSSGRQIVYNVGGESTLNIANLAKIIAQKTKSKLFIPKNENFDTGAPKNVKMNIERVKKEFNYSEFVSFDEGLDNTIKWFQILNDLSQCNKEKLIK
tara:strand:+ start:503 stop:1567 length:1065 start_codon:yes stop_codon:yes gene_type:complete